MGKAALLFTAFVFSACSAFAVELPTVDIPLEKNIAIITATPGNDEVCKAMSAEKDELGRRGCCSWHSGACGCSDGRVVCCDGTYSPTCTCHHDDQLPQM